MSLQKIIDGLIEKIGEDCGLGAVVKFDFGDQGSVILDAVQIPNQVSESGADPDCTMVISIDDFRFAMDVVNTNKGTKELKRAVLNPAIKQLNEKSDLFCIVQDIKDGRTITGFKFVFRTQEQKKLF